MGTLSIISLPTNILVLPAVPFAMALGEAAGLLGSFSLGLAQPFSIATYALLRYVTGTISLFAKVPYAAVTIRQFPLWVCLLSYAGLIWFVFYNRKAYSAGKENGMKKTNKPPGHTEIFTGAVPDNVSVSVRSNRTKVFLESTAEQKVFVPKKKERNRARKK